jgi:membrane-bound lytic murein transglycosylase D
MASQISFAQAPMIVPSEMEFAGIKLKINNSAKKEIEETLDLLTRSQYHFQLLVDRSNLYMGMVEEILKREGIPDDFKYLAIQEGQFISDAVSTSNAVGFWQFKKATAQELGLRVDNLVDERKHIVSSTIGATKYFKRSNFVFDNWLWSLQSYLQGLGGAQRVISEKEYGATKVEIDGKTHWYIKKYIAHKLAFQDFVGRGRKHPELQLATYEGQGKTLKDVSKAVGVEIDELKNLNKWLVASRIPNEKPYKVIYPLKSGRQPIAQARPAETKKSEDKEAENTTSSPSTNKSTSGNSQSNTNTASRRSNIRPVEGNIGLFPRVTGNINNSYEPDQIEVNGINAIKARQGDNLKTLAARTGKSISKLRKYNDIGERGNVRSGQFYYLKNKKARGKVHYHIVGPGETMWSVSQDYGVRLKTLLHKNRMRSTEPLKVGRVLWLRFIRPSSVPVEFTDVILASDQPTPEDRLIKEVSKPAEKQVVTQVKKSEPSNKNVVVIVDKEDEIEDEILLQTKKALIATPSDTIITHLVQPRESFFAISQKYAIEVDDILDWNGLNVMDGLQINQQLDLVVAKSYFTPIKAVESSDVKEISHEVQKGETAWAISRIYGVTVEEILKWNNKTDTNLALGERLKIIPKN